MSDICVVLMAGGVGRRFWPASRQKKPKQFLDIFEGNSSLFQKACERLAGVLVDWDSIYVVSSEKHIPHISKQCPNILRKNLLVEPEGKNTAPCAGYAGSVIRNRHGEESVMVLLPADHLIKKEERFVQILERAAETAADKGVLTTLGITPTRAETGYGYIRKGSPTENGKDVFEVEEFVEKPDRSTAEEYLKSGDYLWNSGMFIWKTGVFLKAFKKHLPDLYDPVMKAGEAVSSAKGWRVIEEVYEDIEGVSLDYGIIEKSDNLAVLEADIGWSDMGSWESFFKALPGDEDGNSFLGEKPVYLNSQNNLVVSEKKKVSVVGMEDTVVVETEDALLVCRREDSQKIKKLVRILEEENPELV